MSAPRAVPCAPADGWPVAALVHQLSPGLPELRVEVVPELDSTNTELLDRARHGHVGPVLLLAEHQRAGRGRRGRRWDSADRHDPGASLTCSFGLAMAPPHWTGLSVCVGLAVAQALGEHVQLKWPNDLWLADAEGMDRKLGGILVETVASPAIDSPGARYVVAGIGLNVRPVPAPPDEAGHEPGAVAPVPRASISQWWPGARAADVLLAIAGPVFESLRRFAQEGFTAAHQAAYAARDALAGRRVAVSGPGGKPLTGTVLGLDTGGALRLLTPGGTITVNSGDVSVRPC